MELLDHQVLPVSLLPDVEDGREGAPTQGSHHLKPIHGATRAQLLGVQRWVPQPGVQIVLAVRKGAARWKGSSAVVGLGQGERKNDPTRV